MKSHTLSKIDELKELRDQLTQLVDKCKGNQKPDCPILDVLADPGLS